MYYLPSTWSGVKPVYSCESLLKNKRSSNEDETILKLKKLVCAIIFYLHVEKQCSVLISVIISNGMCSSCSCKTN